MATVKELKATARPAGGKGAARAERRAGRVPGVIYGNNQPPVTISVDDADLRQRILAGRFLTTIYDIDLEGKKHRVIPRDFHLDPVRDFPLHVDFMRLGEGATIRVSVPLHIQNAETAPGVKRGGTVNIVTHTIDLECSVDNIPQYIEADVSGLEISYSLHLSDVKLPAGVKSLSRLLPPVRLLPRLRPVLLPRQVRLPQHLRQGLLLRLVAPRRPLAATRRSNRARDAASWNDSYSLVLAILTRNTRAIGTTSASWPLMKSHDVMVLHRGVADFRVRSRKSD
jgi:large subunit ribosomal protein L25